MEYKKEIELTNFSLFNEKTFYINDTIIVSKNKISKTF